MQAWKIDSKTKNKHNRALKTPDDSPELVDCLSGVTLTEKLHLRVEMIHISENNEKQSTNGGKCKSIPFLVNTKM